jgi:hypothetical protein
VPGEQIPWFSQVQERHVQLARQERSSVPQFPQLDPYWIWPGEQGPSFSQCQLPQVQLALHWRSLVPQFPQFEP